MQFWKKKKLTYRLRFYSKFHIDKHYCIKHMKMNIPVEELSDIAHFQNRKQVPLKSSWGDKTRSTFLFLNFADSVNTAFCQVVLYFIFPKQLHKKKSFKCWMFNKIMVWCHLGTSVSRKIQELHWKHSGMLTLFITHLCGVLELIKVSVSCKICGVQNTMHLWLKQHFF